MSTDRHKSAAAADVPAEVEALARLTPAQLRARHLDLFGEPTRTGNRAYLVKRLAWRVQSLAHGDLTERAKRRADALARDADLRTTVPRGPTAVAAPVPPPEPVAHARLPGPGTVLTRLYRGRRVTATVLADGFEHDGRVYRSLSAVAKAATGSHWNGHLFFGLRAGANRKGGGA